MPPSQGRYCAHCRRRISHRVRRCPVCRGVNLKPLDYALLLLLLAGLALLALRWL